MNDRILEAISKMNNIISDIKSEINLIKSDINNMNLKKDNTITNIEDRISNFKEKQLLLESDIKNIDRLMEMKTITEIMKKLESYKIKDGEWYYNNTKLGIRATGVDGKDGKDGKDGINGVDGKDGKNGKNGLPGEPGQNGKDGRDGKDGKDGITPEFEIGEVESISTYDKPEIKLRKNKNKYIMDMKVPRGRPGSNGSDGANGAPGKDGKDAVATKINITGDMGKFTEEELKLIKNDNLYVVLDNDGEIFTLMNNSSNLTYKTFINFDVATSEVINSKAIYVQLDEIARNYGQWSKDDVNFPGGLTKLEEIDLSENIIYGEDLENKTYIVKNEGLISNYNGAYTTIYEGNVFSKDEFGIGWLGGSGLYWLPFDATDWTEQYAPTASEMNSAIDDLQALLESEIDDKQGLLSRLPGYSSSKTQVLKNVNGTLRWVDE